MYRSTRFSPCTFWILFKFKFSRTSPCRKIRFEIGRSFESFEIINFIGTSSLLAKTIILNTSSRPSPFYFRAVQIHGRPVYYSSRCVTVQFYDRSVLWTPRFATVQYCGQQFKCPFSFVNFKFLTVQFCDHLLLWPPCFAYFCRRSVYGRLVLPRSFSVFYWTNYFTNDRPLWSQQC